MDSPKFVGGKLLSDIPLLHDFVFDAALRLMPPGASDQNAAHRGWIPPVV